MRKEFLYGVVVIGKLTRHDVFILQRRLTTVDLTPEILFELAERITTTREVRAVGLKLLSDDKVEVALTNHKGNIGDAAYQILRDWFRDQGHGNEAWTALVGVLDMVGLHRLAVQVLGAPQ